MVYNVEHDVFLQEQPYPSWTLNTETYEWDPPTPEPELTEEQKSNLEVIMSGMKKLKSGI
jgi:hypothetical protein